MIQCNAFINNEWLIIVIIITTTTDFTFESFTALNFTWLCRQESGQGGCYKTGHGKVESSEPLLRLNSSLMMENISYFLTVFVKKDARQAEYTQEVFIVPGDPPEVQIRFVSYT